MGSDRFPRLASG